MTTCKPEPCLCVCLPPCATLTSGGLVQDNKRDNWYTSCPRIRLAFLINVTGSDKKHLNNDEQMASFTHAA